MTRRSFCPTAPNSLLAQLVGTTFPALDLAGKTEPAPTYGAEYTRVFSNA